MSEFKNPFRNAKIIADNVASEVYIRQEPGIERGDPRYVMGRSSLVECLVNPFRWVNGFEEQDTKSTDWGTLIDCLVLDSSNFSKRFVVAPESYPATKLHKQVKLGNIAVGDPVPWNASATWCKDWLEENADGKIVIKAKEMKDADKAVEMVMADTEVCKVLKGARFQVLIIAEYHDEATGIVVPVKTLHDIIPDPAGPYGKDLADFKTALSADPAVWDKKIADFGYHVQGSMYLDVYAAACPNEDRQDFLHIVQENTNPFVVERHAMGWGGKEDTKEMSFLELGRRTYMAALKEYAQCLATKTWRGYRPIPGNLCLNGWHYAKPRAYMIQ